MCTVTVINLASEKVVTVDDNIDYEYEAYDMTLIHNEQYIANHVDALIERVEQKKIVILLMSALKTVLKQSKKPSLNWL